MLPRAAPIDVPIAPVPTQSRGTRYVAAVGYACTLHAIDERALGAYADRLVGTGGGSLLARLRRVARSGSVEEAAHGITEVALHQASASGPHIAARGIALSLWDEQLLGKAPWKLTGSVEQGPLRKVVTRWRRLARQLPTSFDGNCCTGVYVPARDVPALVAEVERRLTKQPKGAIRRWLPLLRVLRVAARHGMAYWEGTDLAVQSGHLDWLEEDKPKAASEVRVANAPFSGELLASDGRTAVVASHDEFTTWLVNLTRWPFRSVAHRGLFATDASIARSGRVVLLASDDETTRPHPFRVYALDTVRAKPRCISSTVTVRGVRFVGETPVLFPYLVGEMPCRLRGRRLEPLALPRAVGYRMGHHRGIGADATWFADGTPLLVWDGKPYRVQGKRFVRLAKGDLRPEAFGGCSSVPLDDQQAVVLRERRLVVVTRAGKQTRRFARADNVMNVAPGPDGALLLHEGDSDDGHVAKLWWPNERTWIGVEPEELGIDSDRSSFALWAKEPRLLVACSGGQLRALEGIETRARHAE